MKIMESQATRRPRLGKSSNASGTRGAVRPLHAVEHRLGEWIDFAAGKEDPLESRCAYSRLPAQPGAGKRNSLVTLLLIIANLSAYAGEGMWTPGQLPELSSVLENRGLQITPQSLADLTGHPMKAIVSLGGCTASFVSPKGLVITNHHCAYGSISYNSTEDRNLLRDGFAATSFADELPARPGSRVLVTVSADDVTHTILDGIPAGLNGRARYQAIENSEKALIRECEMDPGHRCRVASYHGGLRYELIKQLEIRDVRLVFAPPASVGNYGGDIDNWMWPRHTGDYSFYRAYVGPDGMPADPAPENVPFIPDHRLKVQPQGIREGDFVMVAGYPGRTNRYRLSSEVANVIGWTYPEYKRSREAWLAAVNEAVKGNPAAALKYASLISGLNNATKNYGGMLEGFARGNLVERKLELERQLQAWIEARKEPVETGPSALEVLQGLVDESISIQQRDLYYGQANRSALLAAARTLYRLAREQEKPDPEREPGYQERDLLRIRERLTRMEGTFDAQIDQRVWRHLLLAYAAIPRDQHVDAFDRWLEIEGTDTNLEALDARLTKMYAGTSLGDTGRRLDWMDQSARVFEASDDPFIRLAVALYDSDMRMEEQKKDLAGRYQEARSQYMRSLLAFQKSRGKTVYPDANGTLRISYGEVAGSQPRDGMTYLPFTTLEGIIEKNTGIEPFDAPTALLDSMGEKRYGAYADDQLGSVPVNFLSTLDTTGGNSGSPTLNGKAELVGLLFDGTFESIISDWDFLPDKTRSIHVDIRYVLWSMEQLGGAERLLKEMEAGD